MKVSELTQAEEGEYESFLAFHAESMLYHTISYRNFLKKIVGGEDRYYILKDKGIIKAVLPTFWKNTTLGFVVNSLPFYGSHGSILAIDEDSANCLRSYVTELLRAPEVLSACLVDLPERAALEPESYDLKDQRIGQWTQIPSARDFDKSFLGMIDSSARRNVAKAKREGFIVNIENTEQAFNVLHEMHVESMQAIGGLPKAKKFFSIVPQIFSASKEYDLFVAREGEIVAGLLVFYHKDTVEYFTPAAYLAHRERQPLPLLIYEAFKTASDRGFRRWNWGGTWTTQEGVYRFKAKWGAIDRPYHYQILLNNRDVLNMERKSVAALASGYYVVPFSELKG